MKCEYCNWPKEYGHYYLCALKTHNTQMWKKGFDDSTKGNKSVEQLDNKERAAYYAGFEAGEKYKRQQKENNKKVGDLWNLLTLERANTTSIVQGEVNGGIRSSLEQTGI